MPDLMGPMRSLLRGQAALEEVEKALAGGASPNVWDGPLSPVRCALQANHPQLLRLLLASRADANLMDDRGVTPLHMAVFEGKTVCINLLLDAAADPNAKDRHGQSPIFFAPTRFVCELLIVRRADVMERNVTKQSPLHLAAHAGLNDAVSWLVDFNKKILESQDVKGRTPLQYAAQLRLAPTVELLQLKSAVVAAAAAVPTAASPMDVSQSYHSSVGPVAARRAANQQAAAMRARGINSPSEMPLKKCDRECGVASANNFDLESEDSQEARAAQRVPNKDVRQEEVDGCLEWEVSLRKESASDKFGFVQANGKLEFETRLANPSQRAVNPGSSKTQLKGPEESPLPGPNVFIVRRIHDGALLHRWNLKYPAIAVQPHDRIVSVNGESSLEGMQREIKSPLILIKFVRYPEVFSLTLKKGDRRLGFRFERPPEGAKSEEVRFTEILAEGALPDYNREQVAAGRFQFVVLPDMRIIKANGLSGDGSEIAEELKRCSEVTLLVRRAEAESSSVAGVKSRMIPPNAEGVGSRSVSPSGHTRHQVDDMAMAFSEASEAHATSHDDPAPTRSNGP